MGFVMPKHHIVGKAQDIETIIKIRPWIEDEWKSVYGEFKKTKLTTDYNAEDDVFSFQITFIY